jgi:hypothetical protein
MVPNQGFAAGGICGHTSALLPVILKKGIRRSVLSCCRYLSSHTASCDKYGQGFLFLHLRTQGEAANFSDISADWNAPNSEYQICVPEDTPVLSFCKANREHGISNLRMLTLVLMRLPAVGCKQGHSIFVKISTAGRASWSAFDHRTKAEERVQLYAISGFLRITCLFTARSRLSSFLCIGCRNSGKKNCARDYNSNFSSQSNQDALFPGTLCLRI